ncbi:MtrAB system histidine kinase MtrB [Lysobacter korlensis]|uniref:Sensor histidine kinase MtrB n=1 Tax=Lysobacter korlensis TaxID=553636 RepID=A0ABV6RWL3_9GAMM
MRTIRWRAALDRVTRLWRSSLEARTVAITVLLSGAAVTLIGSYMSTSIRNNLFDFRLDQLESISQTAATQFQNALNTAVEQGGVAALEAASDPAFLAIQRTAAVPGSETAVALMRSADQDGQRLLVDLASQGFEPENVITEELRAAVRADTERRIYSQSVSLPLDSDREIPALAFGTPIDVLDSDRYELYFVYDLSEAQRTLDLVQQTLILGSFALVLLIAAVTWVVVRWVIAPVRLAAETSERLAAGQLEQRIPVRGEDVIATLGRSFNRMAESLQQQITRLATLSQVQQRFVSDVSHELRTPLTTIRLAGDVLYDQRAGFPPTTARTAELLRTQIDRFELLLSDLLEMSRYDAGAVQLETEPTSLVPLVEDSIDAMRPLAASKGTALRMVAPGGYFEADVDARRIRRILQNLLANAVDHGEGKPIVVHVDSDQHAVAIAVRDYGVGMPPDAVAKVFDRFWRADPSRQRTTGGTGLGLAISLEDAALHGGWLEAWSQEGEGSCFRLTLPRVRGERLESSPLPLPPHDEVPPRKDEDDA